MTMLAEKTDSDIHYTFELGDDGQGSARKYIEYVAGRENLRDGHHIAGLNYHGKDSEVLLGTADMLAWEWTKHLERENLGSPMRSSLAAFIGQELALGGLGQTQAFEGDRILIQHFAGEFLSSGLEHVGRLSKTNDHREWMKILSESDISS